MSTQLERRMAKLEEAAASPEKDRITVIFRRIVCDSGGEVVRARFGETQIDRNPGEDEQEFMNRADNEAVAATGRKPSRVILLPEAALNL